MSKNEVAEEVHVPEANMPKVKTRDELRANVFSKTFMVPKTIELPFHGEIFEWRQPTGKQLQEARAEGKEEDNFMTSMLIAFTYIPGTDQRIFEEGDRDSLDNLPFGGDLQRAVSKIAEILDLSAGVDKQVKN